MARNRNTNTRGESFNPATVEAVWNKGIIIAGQDSSTTRADICGKTIFRSRYGDTASQNGWEIDHIFPVSKGGSDDLSNLQPLQWENNRTKSDSYPWYCS